MTESTPPESSEPQPDVDRKQLIREVLKELHPFPLRWADAEAALAADAGADRRGVALEHHYLAERDDCYRNDPDPLGVLTQVLPRLRKTNGPEDLVWAAGGWHRLVAETDRRLADLDPDYDLFQVKEKFGLLKYYARPSAWQTTSAEDFAAFRAVIEAAETASQFLCEVCGRADSRLRGIPGRGRVRTLCDTHELWGTRRLTVTALDGAL